MIRRLCGLKGRAGRDSRSRGFTLIEIMVASLILLVAMAGIVPLFLTGLSQASAVRYKSIATNIARQKMEQIRQLDYREILDAEFLQERFGTSETQRDITFDVAYTVELSDYEAGNLKKVTVDVTWTDSGYVSAASMSTLIHQQFLGPRISDLEIYPLKTDELGTPFKRLHDKHLGEATGTTMKIHIAQADWGLVFNDLDQPTMTARNVYARVQLFDDEGYSPVDGAPTSGNITDLRYDTVDGKVSDVYFYLTFDSLDIPDGYWEVRAIAYNEYDEPGNMWRLRVRVENGPPAAPIMFIATPQLDNQTVELTWYGGAERDRAYYVLQRQKWDPDADPPDWGSWVTLQSSLNPKATKYTDQGSIDFDDPDASMDPWGTDIVQNFYQYRLWAVDTANRGNEGSASLAGATIPDYSTTTTTELVVETTSTSSTSTTVFTTGGGDIVNKVNKDYTITIKDSAKNTVYTGELGKYGTLTVDGLPAGAYSVEATKGGITILGTFSLPADDGQVLFEVLK